MKGPKKRFTDLLTATKKCISDKILFLVKDRISISVCSLVFWGFRDKSTQKRIILFSPIIPHQYINMVIFTTSSASTSPPTSAEDSHSHRSSSTHCHGNLCSLVVLMHGKFWNLEVLNIVQKSNLFEYKIPFILVKI